MKSCIYLPFIPKDIFSQLTIDGMLVVHFHFSVSQDEIIICSHWVSILMKLFISLVKIQIFLIAFSQRFLSTIIVVLNVLGITSSLSYSGKFHCIISVVVCIFVSFILNEKDAKFSEYSKITSSFSLEIA